MVVHETISIIASMVSSRDAVDVMFYVYRGRSISRALETEKRIRQICVITWAQF